MVNQTELLAFVEPYYSQKDIMHNMWHIELVNKMIEKILSVGSYQVDRDCLTLATYFHGVIYSDEERIKEWLVSQNYNNDMIAKVIQVAWESQRSEVPDTIEGKILHDAHILEGGKAYLFVKTLVTGSVRGQSLTETLQYMEKNVLDKNRCYLPETIPLCDEMNRYTRELLSELMHGIQ